MKRDTVLILAVAALAAAPFAVAQDAPAAATTTSGTTGTIEVGVWTSSLDGSPDVVSRYAPADKTRPSGRLELVTVGSTGRLEVKAYAADAADQKHALDFEIGRVVRSVTTYDRFLDRTGHDPLHNLEAASRNGRIVSFTDTDPTRQYDLTHGRLLHRTEIQPKGLSALTLGVTFRDERRDGYHQGLTISHCDTCHVVSQSHEIGQKVQEGGLDARVNWSRGFVAAKATATRLREDNPSLTLLYDKGLQPELRTPIFDNRLIFDSLQGPQPVDNRQDVDKDQVRADVGFNGIAGFDVSANGAWMSTKNRFTSIEADYQGGSIAITREFKKKTNLRLRGRVYSTSSDSVFVDTPERVGTAGPQAGRTYRQIYGFDPDYTRRSALDRDVVESQLELSHRFSRKAGTVRAYWHFQDVDRDNVLVAVGTGQTTTNLLGLAWRANPAPGLRLNAEYKHGDSDHPYMALNAACSTIPVISVTSPLAPTSTQYFQVHDLRVAETTASPKTWDEVRAQASLVRGKATLSATYRLRDGENQAGDLTDWSRNHQAVTATAWFAPAETWDWFVAYSWQSTELDSHVCIPVFDG